MLANLRNIRAEPISAMLEAGREKPACSLAEGSALALSIRKASENGAVRKDVSSSSIGKVKVNRIVKGVAVARKGLHVVGTARELHHEIVSHAYNNGGLSTLEQIEGHTHRGSVYVVGDFMPTISIILAKVQRFL